MAEYQRALIGRNGQYFSHCPTTRKYTSTRADFAIGGLRRSGWRLRWRVRAMPAAASATATPLRPSTAAPVLDRPSLLPVLSPVAPASMLEPSPGLVESLEPSPESEPSTFTNAACALFNAAVASSTSSAKRSRRHKPSRRRPTLRRTPSTRRRYSRTRAAAWRTRAPWTSRSCRP